MKTQHSQTGFLMIIAIVIILIFATIAVFLTYVVNTDTLSTTNQLGSKQAFYIAEAGLEGGAHQLMIPTIASRTNCGSITGNANLTNNTFTGAAGPFTVTGALQFSALSASTLSSAINASTTTIPITSVAPYASTGRIMIDKELIDYVTVSGNSFVNVQRGAAGTTAAAHASGAPVGQYQCLLKSHGGVPALSPAGGTIGGDRTIDEAVQLPEAWAVGTAGSVIHWNKPTENTWSKVAIGGVAGQLNAVFVLSYADAWIVGNGSVIEHWNGNTWASVAGGANNLLGIFCTASNNCETVGSKATTLVWNGSTWSSQTNPEPASAQLNSVYCNTSTDCWAVGNTQGGTDVILQWTGGASWTLVAASGTQHNLNSVWCTSTSNCWAVGAARTFVLWNGSTWTTQGGAVVSGIPNVAYNGVTCINSNDCWAVGVNSGGASNIVRWQGSAWATVSAPLDIVLQGVSCSKTDSCWAVGAQSSSIGTTFYWDGTSWTSITSNAGNVTLHGVGEIGAATQPEAAWQEQFP